MSSVTRRLANQEQYEFAMARIYELSNYDELSNEDGVELQALTALVESYEFEQDPLSVDNF